MIHSTLKKYYCQKEDVYSIRWFKINRKICVNYDRRMEGKINGFLSIISFDIERNNFFQYIRVYGEKIFYLLISTFF